MFDPDTGGGTARSQERKMKTGKGKDSEERMLKTS
jgi:hypothetical protein